MTATCPTARWTAGGDVASALFMDILRDLKRINSLVTSVAYPILASAGELHETRLACPI